MYRSKLDLELAGIPRSRPRARAVTASLLKVLDCLGVMCAVVYGPCLEDFESAGAVDFFIVVDDEEKAKTVIAWMNKMTRDFERGTGKLLSFKVVTAAELHELEPSELDRTLGSGVQVAGRLDRELVLRELKEPHVMVTVDTTFMKVTERLELAKYLFGSEEVVIRGARAYKITREGLVDKVGGVRLSDSSFVVPRDRVKEVLKALEEKGLRYFAREIFLSQRDLRQLRTRSR
ncbi:hypothetical protein DRO60_04585 [Candidatus Bathyarchaeota archaeon]|nr:MAG: hypothetical protein DRO60_04585 [Candidatus Bathyarchaeota archaeon]